MLIDNIHEMLYQACLLNQQSLLLLYLLLQLRNMWVWSRLSHLGSLYLVYDLLLSYYFVLEVLRLVLEPDDVPSSKLLVF